MDCRLANPRREATAPRMRESVSARLLVLTVTQRYHTAVITQMADICHERTHSVRNERILGAPRGTPRNATGKASGKMATMPTEHRGQEEDAGTLGTTPRVRRPQRGRRGSVD